MCYSSVTSSESARRWGVDGLDSWPNRIIAKDVKSCTFCCYVRCPTLIVWIGAQLGHPDKSRAIKGLVVCNIWVLETLDLLRGDIRWCSTSPEVWIVCESYYNGNKFILIRLNKTTTYFNPTVFMKISYFI